MNNLKYFSKKDLLKKCSDGDINIHNNIKLKNKVQNTLHYVTFLEHLLHLCTSGNTNLLELLFTIKNKIEENINENMNNTYFNQYIEKSIQEWNLDVESDNIFNQSTDEYDYNSFVENNKNYNELLFNINGFENIIQKKDNQFDDDIKDSVIIILTNCNESINSLKTELKKVVKTIKNLEPEYTYLLTDLSTKSKKMYMEYIKNNDNSVSIFDSLITNKNDADIPDNINTIFLNYILIINMIKKELHYIITIYESILEKLNGKYSMLNKLKESLSIKDNVNLFKKEEILDNASDDYESDEDDLTFF
jgi:hypothetical protein